jgi:predicted nucleic acid-binding protein
VKAFLDTSVLVPVFYGDHEHHQASFELFLRSDRGKACCGAHSLAELYAFVTRAPGKYRVSGDQAMLFVATVREQLALITLTDDEYYGALGDAAATGVTGGTIYDALLGACAMKARAGTIYTWNLKHYQQLGPEIARKLRTP